MTPKLTVSDIIKEAQEYERKRDSVEVCGLTSVQPINCAVLNGVAHAGVVTHKCGLQKKHDENSCKCDCGHTWLSK